MSRPISAAIYTRKSVEKEKELEQEVNLLDAHEVDNYTALSAATRAITRSRWNGRLFFGLTKRKKEQ